MHLLFPCVIVIALIAPGLCLECYTCVNQDSNKDKCIKTTIQCEEYHNGCYSEIKWGIPPYWRPHGDRIHKIHKGCQHFDECQKRQNARRHHCRRDWYLDWECIECCRGDMCNYYVTLGSAPMRVSIFAMMISTTVALLHKQWL